MARLTLPTQNQIAPGQLPGAQVAAPQVQSGAVAAAQVGALGQAVTQAADQGSRIQIDVLERANTLRVNQAMNEVRRRALALEYGPEGFRARKGEAAMPMSFDGKTLVSAYDEQYQKGVDDVFSTLGNDAQREVFRAQSQQLGTAFQAQAQAHEFAEMRTYEMSVLDGGIMTAAEEAAVAYDNPDRVGAAIAQIGTLAEEKLRVHGGLAASERTARIQVLQSAAVMQVIKAAADNDDLSLARGYAAKYDGVLTGDDKLRFDALITPAMDADLARKTVADVFSGSDTAPRAEITGEDVVLEAPVDDAPGSGFGPRDAPATRGGGRGSTNHGGTDYRSPAGTAVRASAAGRVKFAGERGGYGNLVIVEHADGRETWYAHLSEIGVRQGQTVDSRAQIAKTGDTGNVSGPHLHYEVRVGGRAVDPSTQLGERNAGAARRADAPARTQGPPATRLEAQARAEAAIGPRATPDQVAAVRREVDRTWALREEARDDQAASALETAQNWLAANNGNVAGMPASMRAAIPGKYMDDVLRYGEAFAKKDEVRETPPEIYARLSDDGELFAMSDAQFLSIRPYVNGADWEAAARRRGARNSPSREQQQNALNLNRGSINAITAPFFRDLGIPREGGTTGGRNTERLRRVGAVQQVLDQYILSEQQAKGRQLNDAELQIAVGRVFSMSTTIQRGLWGTAHAPTLSLNESQIKDTPEWDTVKQRLERRGLRNPTDTQVETEYYRLKLGFQ